MSLGLRSRSCDRSKIGVLSLGGLGWSWRRRDDSRSRWNRVGIGHNEVEVRAGGERVEWKSAVWLTVVGGKSAGVERSSAHTALVGGGSKGVADAVIRDQ